MIRKIIQLMLFLNETQGDIKMTHFIKILFVLFSLSLQGCQTEKAITSYSDTTRLKNDLMVITQTAKPRNHLNIKTLDYVAEYIFNELSINCDTVYYQKYSINGMEYKNVIGVTGLDKKEKLVIGAHYDVAGNQDGADDNASGVVGLLELSRLVSKEDLHYQIEFVAYTLEEPPYFRTDSMGSHVHAKSLYTNNEKLKGMICLEMIGYFNENKHSQDYPIGFLKFFYGNRGDYITVVQKFGNGRFGRLVKRKMKKQDLIKTKSFRAPAKLPGIDFSDHLNYWRYGYDAVMITNTAFYRNKNYHKPADKLETLDIKQMGLVIDEVFLTLSSLF